MPTLLDAPQPPAAARTRRVFRGYIAVALFLVGLLGVTWALRIVQVARVEASAERRQREAVAEAFAEIETRFTALQEEMLAEAQALATALAVVQGLRQRESDAPDVQNGTGRLVQYVAALPPEDRSATELYDARMRLVAWKGFSMHLDVTTETPRFGEGEPYQTAIAQDGELRQALVVWHPVREGTRVLGAVRVLRLLSAQTPVQNRYLRNYRIAETWSRLTGLTVLVQLSGRGGAAAEATPAPIRPLRGLDGTLLGSVSVEPPTPEALVEAIVERFNHVLAFWATLAVLWAVAGVWIGYRTLARTSARGDEHRLLRSVVGFAGWSAAWWGARYALLALDVPARWQGGRAPLNPLFDPAHLASSVGGGLLRSMGDLLLTAFFALVFAITLVAFAAQFRQKAITLYRFHRRSRDHAPQDEGRLAGPASLLRFLAISVLTAVIFVGLVALLAVATRYAVLDSTLDYFARTGLWPEDLSDRLRLIVFCALLALTASVVLLAIGSGWIAGWGLLRYRPTRGSLAGGMLLAVPAVLLSIAGLYLFFSLQHVLPWTVLLLFFGLVLFTFVFSLEQQGSVWALFSLRGVLLALFGVTAVLYPLLYQGMNEQRYLRMQDAAEAFGDGRDPQVDYAIREVLQDVVRATDVAAVVALPGSVEKRQAHLDSAASSFLHSSLLTSLSTYDVSLTFFDRVGVPVGRHYESESVFGRAMLDTADAENLSLLRQIYQETPQEGIKVVPLTGRRETSRFQLAGIAPLYEQAGRFGFVGWAMARAQPQDLLSIGGSAFPRLLTPSGTTDLYADLSLAEFRDGVLVRSFGRDFGRYRLDAEVQGALRTQPRFWRREETKGQRYLTYYRRPPPTFDANGTSSFRAASLPDPVMAVRVPALIAFDHLFYLLRLMIAGLFVAVPLYVVGLYGRWQAGLLPPPRTRFRDRVLNAFLGVGLVSVVTVGIVGLRAVQNEDERDVRSGLQENLDRVEEALARNARGEMPYRALNRIDVDSLAAQVGLDLNVYRQEELVSSSRPDLVRERLINDRLPIEAYYALYFDGYRFAVTEEQAGDFTYTVGFKAVPDERGRPTYVLSTATLPEQERIEEERSRTVAYLFGALLLLLFIVMLTAALLAGALTRPIGRLREGLEAAAQGRYQGVDPTGTHDEIGDLVQAFNRMQEQLAESRRKLAQQERQLAWREMARQVAHEIKNPLTPMKLSVQHLRRAYDEEERATSGDGVGGPPDEAKARRFTGMFDRITATLLEQIDALKRIADEFHSFARLPTRVLEPLDLGTVIREAAALMQEEETAEITLRLHASPLILEADREELRRIYINLIKNAIQAIPESRPGRIEVITTREATDDGPGWAYSTIKDNGTGIPADVSASIFEPNFSTKTSGTGLGLAIVKKGIEDLNGEIGFETEADVGTTFRVRLPLSE